MRLWQALLAICVGSLPASVEALAPFVGADGQKAIPNSYIVVLKNEVSDTDYNSHLSWADGILRAANQARKSTFAFEGFRGYSLQVPDSVAKLLAESDQIAYIEADQKISIATPSEPLPQSKRGVQQNAPWNLARISHRQRGATDFVYDDLFGTYVYILDTGIRVTHRSFEGRALVGYNPTGGSNTDGNGHGTHVAGIVASKDYGVLKKAIVIGVKVFGDNGSGSTSIVLDGLNWAVNDARSKGRIGQSTALMALGGAYSVAINNAVKSASNAGLFISVAAGGENQNAANSSPASEPSACTVGGTTRNDARASSSNYGSVVDIFAPAQDIISTWITSDTSSSTLSGTSMAAAHIAGLGAYFLAREGPRSPAALCARLQEVATKDVITGIPAGSNTPNLLAYNDSGL